MFDNGEVYGWGNNEEGILANNHIREYIYATGYYTPTKIHPSYNGRVVDFDISTNLFVMLTDNGQVYYAGFEKFMKPTLLEMPGDSRPVKVGASTDGFGVAMEDGSVYGWNVWYDGDQKFFKQNLTRLPAESFGSRNVLSMGGKYGSKFVMTD